MMRTKSLILGGLLLSLQACGGGLTAGGKLAPDKVAQGHKTVGGGQVSKEAAASYDGALSAFHWFRWT